ncbi:hypothetical protein ACIBG7_41725 [Nonomuraea sp. NPDC050328]|uniref:hypothetical protein n=1 Tax=Nonomuraea sp. NPDC050328 TaxID=3364361 RepID=UPI0037A66DBB
MRTHDMTHHAAAQLGGLAVSESGYTLEFDGAILPAGTQPVSFRIIGPDGRPVTDFVTEHEKELHLIVVRRDTTGFQHVHPVMDAEGTWRVDVRLEPGVWRFFADIHPAAHHGSLTLGVDVSVAGPYEPEAIPAERREARVGAYTVTLDGGLAHGELAFTVRKDGETVTDLQPYLGAHGHLVALRVGDLGYLHVHPEERTGPEVAFAAHAPAGGLYRLYLDFQHDDVVRTAEFTMRAAHR